MDFDVLLFDRLERIKSLNELYDLENNSYIAFSGGKDSTILHYLIDMALPNNNIPRLFINTGVEYSYIVDFVKDLKNKDSRFIIFNNRTNLKWIFSNFGYPYKSKIHSNYVFNFRKNGLNDSIVSYLDKNKYLSFQFDNNYDLNISSKCCYFLKKKNAYQFSLDFGRNIAITGMRRDEGGQRSNINCLAYKHNKVSRINPLYFLDDDFMNTFVERFNIKLCKLYYYPFNFMRTGCRGCPYNANLQVELTQLFYYDKKEFNKCVVLWKKVYLDYLKNNIRLISCTLDRRVLNDILRIK